MARITIEDCEPLVPNRFHLVVLASQRVKEFYDGAQPTVPKDNDKDPVIALREIANQSVSVEDLKNSLIESYRQTAFFESDDDDEEEDDDYDPEAYSLNASEDIDDDDNDNDDAVEQEAAIDFSCIIKDGDDEESIHE